MASLSLESGCFRGIHTVQPNYQSVPEILTWSLHLVWTKTSLKQLTLYWTGQTDLSVVWSNPSRSHESDDSEELKLKTQKKKHGNNISRHKPELLVCSSSAVT